ncbi:hypothetical protein [Halomonas sp. 15WGF]|jgi:hypothetical protein|uniref:phage tail terminator protein n=1 Tax=Halomonas sp. 15WGF TaxID=2570357 RepID=UPI0010BE9AA6|nr:hypothetical protein [Halomonas sp. 15WGF]MED5558302.1 hypothetical protein [Pseudomonadota bacterium]TKJ10205.1 hypothetical protein E8Q34_12270 [Halomonas sp. 15WGF]
MNDPDIIDQLLARVRDQCPGLATVEEAWFAEPIDHFETQTPAALAYLAEDGADDAPNTLRPVQPITLTYGLWLVCKRADFKSQRQAIRSALMGYGFSQYHNPMAYRGGQTTDIRGDFIWWREFWTVSTHLRGQRTVTV